MDHSKLWLVLKEMGVPGHLVSFQRLCKASLFPVRTSQQEPFLRKRQHTSHLLGSPDFHSFQGQFGQGNPALVAAGRSRRDTGRRLAAVLLGQHQSCKNCNGCSRNQSMSQLELTKKTLWIGKRSTLAEKPEEEEGCLPSFPRQQSRHAGVTSPSSITKEERRNSGGGHVRLSRVGISPTEPALGVDRVEPSRTGNQKKNTLHMFREALR